METENRKHIAQPEPKPVLADVAVKRGLEIKEGEPQPFDCPNCGDKQGYRVSKSFKIESDDIYDSNGNYVTMIDSEYRKKTRQLKTATCTECLSKLPFRIAN